MLIIYLTITITLALLIGKLIKRRKLNLPPGPVGLPLLGYLPFLDRNEPYKSLTILSQKYGSVCGLQMGTVYTVLLSDPKLVRQTLAKDVFSGRAPLYLTHGIMNGYGLICAEGDHWREQRQFVLSTLKTLGMVKHGGRRDKLEEKILSSINDAIEKLKVQSNDTPVDPMDILHHTVGNLMNDIVFGVKYEENNVTWQWLRHVQEEGVKHIGVAGPLNFLPILRHLPYYSRIMATLIDGKLKTHELYRKLIDAHNTMKCEKSDHFLAAFSDKINERMQTTGQLGSFTEQQYYHLLADLFGAGTDTSLTTLRWFLLFMAVLPEQQEKIYREMKCALADKPVTLNDRDSLIFLNAAICEVQRLRSVVPTGIPHGAIEDAKIDNYDIPKGTMIIPLQWAIHMNPNYWHEPESFKLERFVDVNGHLMKPMAFMPFQTGKRMCVGDELARMILFLYAGRIIQLFQIKLPSGDTVDLNGECGITLVPKYQKLIFSLRL